MSFYTNPTGAKVLVAKWPLAGIAIAATFVLSACDIGITGPKSTHRMVQSVMIGGDEYRIIAIEHTGDLVGYEIHSSTEIASCGTRAECISIAEGWAASPAAAGGNEGGGGGGGGGGGDG